MFNFSVLLVPFALFLPFPLEQSSQSSENTQLVPLSDQASDAAGPVGWSEVELPEMESPLDVSVQNQVRIEQRVIIRISPQRTGSSSFVSETNRSRKPQKWVERRIGNCVKVGQVAGVQTTRDNRLILYMKDRRVISANLEKSCSARDFYSGFYVEPSKDGKLCISRDKLQSRTGVKCQLSRIRQLVLE